MKRANHLHRRLDHEDIKVLIKMRGLGFLQEDIALKLQVSQSTVAYHIRGLRRDAKEKGLDAIWRRYFPYVRVIEVGGD